MAKQNIIAGLDVGTSAVRTVIALTKNSEGRPRIIGVGEAPSFGMRRGAVVDIDDVMLGIKQSVEQAELSSGVPVEHAYVSIGGSHIGVKLNKGLVAVLRADQEVSEEDISRVIDSASTTISLPQNREIIHIIPKDFKLDSEEHIQYPLGMTGSRLEVDAIIIDGLSPYVKNLTKCVSNLGIRIDGLILNVLAASSSVLSKRQKEVGVLVLDLGGGTASMAVYEEGKLLHVHILPIGSFHVTSDIAIGLRTTLDLAEKIKLEYGIAMLSEVKKKEIINLAELDGGEEGTINRRELARIIEARLQEIFELVNKELRKIGKQKLPAGVVLVGGGSLMPGIVELAKQEIGLSAQIGIPSEADSVIEKTNSPSFATATGLVLWALRLGMTGSQRLNILQSIPSNTVSVLKKWFRALWP